MVKRALIVALDLETEFEIVFEILWDSNFYNMRMTSNEQK